jgi:hypothetical protein
VLNFGWLTDDDGLAPFGVDPDDDAESTQFDGSGLMQDRRGAGGRKESVHGNVFRSEIGGISDAATSDETPQPFQPIILHGLCAGMYHILRLLAHSSNT